MGPVLVPETGCERRDTWIWPNTKAPGDTFGPPWKQVFLYNSTVPRYSQCAEPVRSGNHWQLPSLFAKASKAIQRFGLPLGFSRYKWYQTSALVYRRWRRGSNDRSVARGLLIFKTKATSQTLHQLVPRQFRRFTPSKRYCFSSRLTIVSGHCGLGKTLHRRCFESNENLWGWICWYSGK